ncbi:MAG TPA: helix-turn-helix domain-containing protein [Chitinophagaceae bacterium]|nr:helix-turn-helix domain-containing protein [Chitinophagaceae bacterium]
MKTEINTIDERLGQIENDVKQIKIMLKNILSNYAQSESKGENLLNVKDVSSFLKVDNNFIYSACSKGELPFIKIGKSYRFKKEDILKWMERCQDKKGIIIDDYVTSYLQKNIFRG